VKSRCARGRARLAVMLGHLHNLDQPAPPHATASAPAVPDRAARNPTGHHDVPSRTGQPSGAAPAGKEGGS
jgi:RNA polymerase sigma-70 factor (ECF subfamily)